MVNKILLLAVCWWLAPIAQSASLDRIDNVHLVPYAVYQDTFASTVVGITAIGAGTLHWIFYDANGQRLGQGTQALDDVEKYGFVLATEATNAGINAAGTPGFLIFAFDSNNDGRISLQENNSILVQAFDINLSSSDVAFLPTLRIEKSNLSSANINSWSSNPVERLSEIDTVISDIGLPVIFVPYVIDGIIDNSESTDIILFTTSSPGNSQFVQFFNTDGSSHIAQIAMPNTNLNIIDPETISTLPDNFKDGIMSWDVPPDADKNAISATAFSLIGSAIFGATQTLQGGYIDSR